MPSWTRNKQQHARPILMFPVPKCAQVPSCEFGSVPCAAGGEFGLSNGDWFDSVRSQVCKSCPILPSQNTTDPALVICEGNTVKSQPGYYSYFLEEPYPYAELALAQCPNLRACKNEGFVNSTCANSLSVCNGNSNLDKTVLGKCAVATLVPICTHTRHTTSTSVLQGCSVHSATMVGSQESWCVHHRSCNALTICVPRALLSAKLVQMHLCWLLLPSFPLWVSMPSAWCSARRLWAMSTLKSKTRI